MRVLAMDTATSAITVAVHDGEQVLAARSTIDARRHTELLAPLLIETMAADFEPEKYEEFLPEIVTTNAVFPMNATDTGRSSPETTPGSSECGSTAKS